MNYFFELLNYKNTPWLILFLAGVIGFIISIVVIKIIKLTAAKKDWRIVRAISQNLTNVLCFFIPLVLITAVTKTYSLSNPGYEWTHAISKTLLIAVTTWLMTRIVVIIEKILIEQLDFDTEDNNYARRMFTKIKFIKRIIIILIILIGVSILLLSFDSVRQYGIGILTSGWYFQCNYWFCSTKIAWKSSGRNTDRIYTTHQN